MRPDAVTDFSQFAKLRADARGERPEALRKTAQQFESLLMQQMLKNMRAASLGDDVLGGEQTQFYQEMFDQQLAQHLAAGKGLGIADLLVKQLSQSRASSNDGTAGTEPVQGSSGKHPANPARASRAGDTSADFAGRAMPAAAGNARVPGGHGPPYDSSNAGEGFSASALPGNSGESRRGRSAADFVKAVLPHAEKAAAELGIPAKVLVAQAALETGWGRHAIRRDDGSQALNLFGIKADKRWQGEGVEQMTSEYQDGRMQRERATFRAYDSVGESFADYVRFLKSNPRYQQALQHGGDSHRFAAGLQKAGYATDPDYAQKILRIAEGRTMKLALSQAMGPKTYTV